MQKSEFPTYSAYKKKKIIKSWSSVCSDLREAEYTDNTHKCQQEWQKLSQQSSSCQRSNITMESKEHEKDCKRSYKGNTSVSNLKCFDLALF